MTDDFEHGFGTGLRAQLQRKQEQDDPPAVALPEPELTPVIVQATVPELNTVRNELEEALAREQQLREALQHEIEGHERELAAGRDLALREAEAEQLAAKAGALGSDLEEREHVLAERLNEVAAERRDLNMRRTELIAEEARLTELATHVEGRAADLDSADHERAEAAAELAKQLAAIAERERQIKRERASADERRGGAEARLATREQGLREHDEAVRVREQAVAGHERRLEGEVGELQRERERLRERVEAVAAREADIAGRLAAREETLADREAAVGAWEERVRAQSERVERERAGHGHASQEAFSLMSELEQREAALKQREASLAQREAELGSRSALRELDAPKEQAREKLLARGEARLTTLRDQLEKREEQASTAAQELLLRAEAVEQAEHELRLRDARLGAELELQSEKLEALGLALAERERLLGERERDLAGYVTEVQERFSGGEAESWPEPVASGRPAA